MMGTMCVGTSAPGRRVKLPCISMVAARSRMRGEPGHANIDEADGVSVNLATKKCHGSSGSQAAGVDVRSSEAKAQEGLGQGVKNSGEIIRGKGGVSSTTVIGT